MRRITVYLPSPTRCYGGDQRRWDPREREASWNRTCWLVPVEAAWRHRLDYRKPPFGRAKRTTQLLHCVSLKSLASDFSSSEMPLIRTWNRTVSDLGFGLGGLRERLVLMRNRKWNFKKWFLLRGPDSCCVNVVISTRNVPPVLFLFFFFLIHPRLKCLNFEIFIFVGRERQ